MTKKDWLNYFLLLWDIYRKDKKRIICMIISALMEVLCVYTDIIVLGKGVDLLLLDFELDVFYKFTLLAFGIRLLFIIIKKETKKYFDIKIDYTRDIENKYMNDKAMSFGYENLENPKVSNLRYSWMGDLKCQEFNARFFFNHNNKLYGLLYFHK